MISQLLLVTGESCWAGVQAPVDVGRAGWNREGPQEEGPGYWQIEVGKGPREIQAGNGQCLPQITSPSNRALGVA